MDILENSIEFGFIHIQVSNYPILTVSHTINWFSICIFPLWVGDSVGFFPTEKLIVLQIYLYTNSVNIP